MLQFLKRLFSSNQQKTAVKNTSAAAHSYHAPSAHQTPPAQGKIIAARVEEVTKHPNADRLQIVTLFTGSQTITPVVCGAKNFSPGDIVALALPGATIAQNIHSENHESFTLNTAKIRGVESQGMICSAFELGKTTIPEDSPEILLLPPETTLGTIITK